MKIVFKNVLILALVLAFLLGVFNLPASFLPKQVPEPIKEAIKPKEARAVYQFTPTGGQLVTGAEVAASLTNISTWRGLTGNDGRYWSTTRDAVNGLNKQIFFDGVAQNNANKMIITAEDANVTTADAYRHQICDWVSTTLVDAAADAACTGGGWRTLNMRKVDYTNTADTTRTYEIYDGYFWDRTTTPGTKVNTPIANFINTDVTKRVLIRVFSTVASVVQHNMDEARIELAIDPVYEPSGFTKIAPFAGATTAFVSDLIGTGASDANKLSITNNATNPLDVYFSFTNIRTYTGANTIVVKPEICVSATALTFNVWIWNFTTSGWEQLNTALVTGTACTTDTAYAYAKNNVTLTDYVSANEVRIRFNTATLSTNTFQLDRLYLMVGSTNTDSALCEISAGTGTATNCVNTRTVADPEGGSTANTTTWQVTSVLEYPGTRWALDDDNATDAEAIRAANLSFPVTIGSNMAVTALHWAVRWRSNVTTETIALNAKDYGAALNTTGGWSGTLGTTNALTTYGWTDSWQSVELQTNPEDYVDTVNNLARLRSRTSATTDTTAGDVGDWDFAMVSVRWVETSAVGPTISCSTNVSSTSFGTLTTASVFTSSPNASTTMSCSNTTLGCTLYVKDAGNGTNPGLSTSSPPYLIPSPDAAFNATATLATTTEGEGYGIQATTTSPGLTIDVRYDQTGDTVGGLASSTDLTLASSTADVTGVEVIVTHKAAISVITPPGTYEDIITYSCIVNT